MIEGLWGRKLGMTQLFSESGEVLPVTAVRVSGWIPLRLKTEAVDGYAAVVVGYPRDRFLGQPFKEAWTKSLKRYFRWVREIKARDGIDFSDVKIGSVSLRPSEVLSDALKIDVFGKSKGRGFAGVMARYGFSGGPKTHGSHIHRTPGSIGSVVGSGKVFKGKRMPGRYGGKSVFTGRLGLVRIMDDDGIVLVKGSVPGVTGDVVFIQRAG